MNGAVITFISYIKTKKKKIVSGTLLLRKGEKKLATASATCFGHIND